VRGYGWVGVSVCARLSLKVPRRRPLPARPSAAPGSDCAWALSPFLGGEEVLERRSENPERGIRLQPGLRRRCGGGGADVGRGRPGREGRSALHGRWESLVASPRRERSGAKILPHFKGLEQRVAAWWRREVLKLGVGVQAASAEGRWDSWGWDSFGVLEQVAAGNSSSVLVLWVLRGKTGVPRALGAQTAGESDAAWAQSQAAAGPECCTSPFPGSSWQSELDAFSTEYHE
jgi:hypothetical protein